MRIAIMQPYFFPYIGYFQTIKNCDLYVNLDHVNFMKSGFMTRNILKDNISINIEINNASSFEKCCNTYVKFRKNYIRKFKNKLYHLYHREINYEKILNEIIDPIFSFNEITISELNLNIIKKICQYLDINTKIIDSSVGITNKKGKDGVIEIIKTFKGTEYINSYGGLELYSFHDFKKNNIKLMFIKPSKLNFPNPYTSILDLLFTHEKEVINENLNNFELIFE